MTPERQIGAGLAEIHFAGDPNTAMVCTMENEISEVTFFGRLGMALRLLFNGEFARQVLAGLKAIQAKPARPAAVPQPPPERTHASGLLLLAALQREGRLLDFLQQDIAGFGDDEVGAAARVVHSGCKKVLGLYLKFEPILAESEGSPVTVPTGFDAQRIRLTGQVTGQPPFRGTLKHHGWLASQINLPAPSESLDPRIVAPAEVELG